jgi:uncharacterized iron-regulated membrane protein
MPTGLRIQLNALHTWAGVILGPLLFAIFWMGTLAVFDKEIDRWMMPATRLAMPATFSYEALRPAYDRAVAAKAPSVLLLVPNERSPVITGIWRPPGSAGFVQQLFDPVTGAPLPDPGTLAGSRFIYPFHYNLNLKFLGLGTWIVGLCAMLMMALCVSGVVIHRKLITDFFTFRPERQTRRMVLDLHNLAGVLGLPFHIVISVSGLVILFALYLPAPLLATYGQDLRPFFRDSYGSFARPPARQPATLLPFDEVVARARAVWGPGEPNYLYVFHPDDAAAYVQVNRASADVVGNISHVVYVDGVSGAVISERRPDRPVAATQRFIAGLHFIQFRHWTLRWLYFGLGLAGCALIATGLLFWVASRREAHARAGLRGARVVEAIAVAAVPGIIAATGVFMVANRLLPAGAALAGLDRAGLEIAAFYGSWVIALLHALVWRGRAWVPQCAAVAALALLAVILNAVTTGTSPLAALARPELRAVAGVDAVLLAGAVIAAFTAWRLHRRARGAGASA